MQRKIYVVLLSLVVFGIIFYVGLVVKIYSYVNINEAQMADVIVVMGASQWGGQPSPVFQARLDHAFSLYQAGFFSDFILTGGVGDGEKISESETGRNYLMEKDITSQHIFMEKKGRTSLQSLEQVVQILEDQKMDSIILVSDGFHVMRLKKMAKDLKINVYVSAASNYYMNNLTELKYVLRESVVYLLYLLFRI